MDALSSPSFAVFLPGCGFLCSLSIIYHIVLIPLMYAESMKINDNNNI
jgi:hypothetical protein